MSSSSDTRPGLHLPEPVPSVGGPAPAGQAPLPAFNPSPSPLPSAVLPPIGSTATTVQAPMAAADDDVIEKEWVLKAKQLVARTKLDPFEQNRQLAVFKADYVRKRYGKEVKVSDQAGATE